MVSTPRRSSAPRFINSVRVPSQTTLDKYGLTEALWLAILKRQHYVCGVCAKVPPSSILHVEHYHARGFAKMTPEDKRKYIRGLACPNCNRSWLKKGATPTILRAAANYLEAYEERNKKATTN